MNGEASRKNAGEWEGIVKGRPSEQSIELSTLIALDKTNDLVTSVGIENTMRALINMAVAASVAGPISLLELPQKPSERVIQMQGLLNTFLKVAASKGDWETPFFEILKAIGFTNQEIVYEIGRNKTFATNKPRIERLLKECQIIPPDESLVWDLNRDPLPPRMK